MRPWLNGFLALMLLAAWPAQAQKLSSPNAPLGEKFIDLCRSPNINARDACGGVVTSLLNAHIEMSRQDPSQRIICPPRLLSIEEGRRVFIQWAESTPDAISMNFPALVMRALRERYQCAGYLKQPTRKSR